MVAEAGVSPDAVIVVIPFHHRRDLLGRALESARPWRCIVVDDSPDGVLGTGEELDAEVVRTSGEVGFAKAANAGLAAAEARGAEAVLLLNDDAELTPGCVDALASALEDGVMITGPVLEDAAGRAWAGLDLSWWGRLRERAWEGSAGPPRAVSALSGACLLLRSSLRFDAAFRHGMEDVALCRDVWNAGRAVHLVPSARCLHVGGGTVDRRAAAAARHAVSGHLRLVGGGWRTGPVVALALAQTVREGPQLARVAGVWRGWQDWRRRPQG